MSPKYSRKYILHIQVVISFFGFFRHRQELRGHFPEVVEVTIDYI
jgi:hypothetical protein